jgi:hypothetical protein
MFKYYRFLNCKYEKYKEQILEQAKLDKLQLQILNEKDPYRDSNKQIINIVIKCDVIIDIYIG